LNSFIFRTKEKADANVFSMLILKIYHITISYLMNKLNLGFSPPHRNQVSQKMEILYNHHYELLKYELKQVQGLSITFDFWSSRQMQSFLCITGQWYTDNIDPVSKIIDFSIFNYHHTGLDIARVVKEKLVALDIYEKIVCITCDGAPNMIMACYYLNDKIPRIWCSAHRLHLVVINGLGFWLTEDNIKDYNNNNISTAHAATTVSLPPITTTTTPVVPPPTTTVAATTTTTIPTFMNNYNNDDVMDVNWDEALDEGNCFNGIFVYGDEEVNIIIHSSSQFHSQIDFSTIPD
jgi:hypothetical protein